MSPLEQRMLIYWHIRYFCDKEQRMKDRILFLDTDNFHLSFSFRFLLYDTTKRRFCEQKSKKTEFFSEQDRIFLRFAP